MRRQHFCLRDGRTSHFVYTAMVFGFMVMAHFGSLSQVARSADLTWDADGVTAGQIDGGGTWDNAGNSNWWDGANNVQWNNANGDTAIFGVNTGAAGTVNLAAGGVTAGGLTFNAPGSGNYTIASDTLTLTGAANITTNVNATITSVIADSGSGFTKLGAAKLTVNNTANTFTGPLTIAEGTYTISSWNNTSAVGPLGNSASKVTLGALATQGTLEYAGGASNSPATLKGLDIAAGGGKIQLTMGGTRAGSYVHLNGSSLTGTGPLVVDTSNAGVYTSRFILVGPSTYAGNITINSNSELQTNSVVTGDTFAFGVGTSGQGPAITMNAGSVLTAYGPGNTPQIMIGSLTGPATSVLNAESGTIIYKIGGDGTSTLYEGAINNQAGTGAITKVGGGTLTLTGNSNFTGAVNITAGAISVPAVANGTVNSPLGAGIGAIGLAGGTLQFTGTTASGSTNRGLTLGTGGGTVQVDTVAETLTIGGNVTGANPLTKTGAGKLALTGAANTYSGLTTVSSGELSVDTWNGATAFALSDQTTLTYTGAGGSQAGGKGLALPGTAGQSATISVTNPAAILNFASAGSNTITGAGDLVKEGAGTLQLAQASVSQNWNGKTTINAGSVDYFGGGSMLRTVAAADAFTVNNGGTFKLTYTGGSSTISANNGFVINGDASFEIYTGANFTHNFANVISGPGNFIKTGTGTMQLSGANTFTGTVSLNQGAITLASWNQSATDGSWGNLANNTFAPTTSFIQMNGATINYTGGNAGGNLRGVNLVSGDNVINITNAGATLNFQGGGFNTFQGNGGNLIKEGPGTLQIGAAGVANNVFNNSKVVINAGTLEWWGAGSMPNPGGFGASDAITINNGGTFRLSYPDVPTVVDSAIGFRLSGNATVGVTGDHTFAGVVADKTASTGTLVKTGAGILGLSNVNTYTGSTVVNAGTLRLTTAGTNNIATSPLIDLTTSATGLNVAGVTGGFTLASGQTLKGTGTVTGDSTVGAGSFLSPGNSPGTMPFVGNHTWAGLGNLVWEINDATGAVSTNWDLITVSALLDVTATSGSKFNIDLVGLDAGNALGVVPGFSNGSSYTWLFADTGSAISSFDASKFSLLPANFAANNPLGGGTFGIVRGDAPGIGGDDTQLYLTFTPVPEPSAMLLLLGIPVLMRHRARKNRE